jgi:hypothetical protein
VLEDVPKGACRPMVKNLCRPFTGHLRILRRSLATAEAFH